MQTVRVDDLKEQEVGKETNFRTRLIQPLSDVMKNLGSSELFSQLQEREMSHPWTRRSF